MKIIDWRGSILFNKRLKTANNEQTDEAFDKIKTTKSLSSNPQPPPPKKNTSQIQCFYYSQPCIRDVKLYDFFRKDMRKEVNNDRMTLNGLVGVSLLSEVSLQIHCPSRGLSVYCVGYPKSNVTEKCLSLICKNDNNFDVSCLFLAKK